MVPSRPLHQRRLAADATRARIIEAAIAELAESGMRGLTHRRVEARADASQGLVKHHFGSLSGLIRAVVEHMAELELTTVMTVSPEQQASALSSGEIPPQVWQAAHASWQALKAQPGLVRARFELYLHAAGDPELQAVLRAGHERFITATAASLPSQNPRASAELVLALVNGLLLHHLSTPDADLDHMAPALILAAGTAALQLPLPSSALSPTSDVLLDHDPRLE